MPTIDTVVIGAGHAGLATSRLLESVGRDHVVLDRGRVGERWRTERWHSLHLLTPNWMMRLPGWTYAGPEPDGFMSAAAFVSQLETYAASFAAPVVPGTRVERVSVDGDSSGGFGVTTDRGVWRARHVVVASGTAARPYVPAGVHPAADVLVTTAAAYRSPGSLPDGGVLVVGASSSGVQIADELASAGRDVTLAVGRHTRMPRRYRGMDIFWWLEQTGRLGRTIDEVRDPVAARREASMQLVGRPDGQYVDVDLESLRRRGVRLLGRLESLTGHGASFRDDLAGTVADADRRLHRLLDAVDRYVHAQGLEREVWAPVRPAPAEPPPVVEALDLRAARISTVVLATGYLPDYSWLGLPLLDARGGILQRRGVTSVPGLYVVGQRFQHRRDSSFIDGARHDAEFVVDHLVRGDGARPAAAADIRGDR